MNLQERLALIQRLDYWVGYTVAFIVVLCGIIDLVLDQRFIKKGLRESPRSTKIRNLLNVSILMMIMMTMWYFYWRFEFVVDLLPKT